MSAWQPLVHELEAWRDAGRQPRFWLRDDDAVEPTPALDTLLALTRQAKISLALAVIPAHATEALASRLSAEPHASVLVHGWSHENHAPSSEKKQELGTHRPAAAVLGELARGLATLDGLHGPQLAPVLVPPWNRIAPELLAALPELGFAALSTFGRPKPGPLPLINSSVDIIDWHGTRGCRDTGILVGEIVAQLRTQFIDPAAPAVGLLTHHLVHDAAADDFLAGLFAAAGPAGGGRWLTIGQLLDHTLQAGAK